MRRWILAGFFVFGALLSLGALDWLVSLMALPLVQYCPDGKYNQATQENCTAYHVVLFGFLGESIRGISVFLDKASNAIIALATVAICYFTYTLWKSADRADRHFTVSERAYVKLSHHSPGLSFSDPNPSGRVIAEVRVAAKNWGNTPATVSDIALDLRALGKSIPSDRMIPDNAKTALAFLAPGEDFTFGFGFVFSAEDYEQFNNFLARARLVGYVDYIDQFGNRWRNGYERIYFRTLDNSSLPASERNNLVISRDSRGHYDRPRKPGEGIDWDWEPKPPK